jgi:hypothetical protein
MIFKVTDPKGRSVLLKKGTWEHKIQIEHMEVNIDVLERLAGNPYYILRDLTQLDQAHPTREEYVDLIPSPVETSLVIIRAIIDHATAPGEVVTAFISSKTKGLFTQGGIVYVRPESKG